MFSPRYFSGRYWTGRYFTRSLTALCLVELDPAGRRGIAVMQLADGPDYPLVQPSDDIRYLLADFRLRYDDPADYDARLVPFRPPFRIAWLAGFGCVLDPMLTSDSFSVSESHIGDLAIVDADGRIVFDSTDLGVSFAMRTWGPRLQIYVWEAPSAECRVVIHTRWPEGGDPVPRDYSDSFEPESAVLDPRTVVRAPKRILSIEAAGVTVADVASLQFVAGYNMDLTATAPAAAGVAEQATISFAAVAGAGSGLYPACTPTAGPILTIDGKGPDADGNFLLAATGCYWVRQPSAIADGVATVTASTLQVGNDCGPCCDCDDYRDMSTRVRDTLSDYEKIAHDVNKAADQYRTATGLWQATRDAALAQPIQLVLQPQFNPFCDIMLQITNNDRVGLYNVTATVILETNPIGGFGALIPNSLMLTDEQGKTMRYSPNGDFPSFTIHWDSIPTGRVVSFKGRMAFTDKTVYVVTASATVSSAAGALKTPSGATASASTSATLNPPQSSLDTFMPPTNVSE